MADHDADEIMNALAHSISSTYSLLVDVCQALPVPITMPTDRHIPTSTALPAIRRAEMLAQEEPMGETQEVQLRSGCIYLLAAIDLYALCATRYEETRAEGVGANLLHADDALKTLLVWLLANTG
ncbi:hypothetical protein ACFXAZ_36740 [Streptomyces sp. NPDC059477]|uniref:hypothetical protein n=1 Tax=Streptomyces sp. NPDC059477 TaxID=3346847 RepID=UPI0036A3E352